MINPDSCLCCYVVYNAVFQSLSLYKTEWNNLYTYNLVFIKLFDSTLFAYPFTFLLISGGAKESRTPDLLRAKQALYQLS